MAWHGPGAGEMAAVRGGGASLRGGEANGEALGVRGRRVARLAERGGDFSLTLPPPTRNCNLQEEQLVEREPSSPRFRLRERARTVQSPERVGALGQPLAFLQLREQRIGERARQRGADELAELLRGDLLAGRIDRREIRSGFAVADVEAPHVEPVPTLPAS